MCACALLVAATVVIAYMCKLFMTFGAVRVTFENLPIIMAGIFFGPLAGLLTGVSADLISTAVSQYGIGGINPLITLGAGAVGLVAGLVGKGAKKGSVRLGAAVYSAHIVGNIIIKSAGLMLYFSYSLPAVLPRIPLYLIIATAECIVIYVLTKSSGFRKAIGVMK